MSTLSLHPTTSIAAAVGRHAATLKDLLRQAFSRTTKPQSDYIRNVKKAVLSTIRCKAVELVVALVVDLARRGSLAEAEAIGLHLQAIARAEHAAANGSPTMLSRAEAQIAEEHAEGLVEEAETRLSLYPTLANRLAYLAASAEHSRARQQLDAAVRREVASA